MRWSTVLALATLGGCTDGDGKGGDTGSEADTDTDADADADADSDADTDTDTDTLPFAQLAVAADLCGDDTCIGAATYALDGTDRGYVAYGDLATDQFHVLVTDGGATVEDDVILGDSYVVGDTAMIDVAVDPTTGTVYVAWNAVSYDYDGGTLHLSQSADRGATWTDEVVDAATGSAVAVSLDAHGGTVGLAWYDHDLATPTDASVGRKSGSTWEITPTAQRGGPLGHLAAYGPTGVAVDPTDGTVVAAYFLDTSADLDSSRHAMVWSPQAGGAPTELLNSNDLQNDYFDVALAFDETGRLWSAVDLQVDGADERVWVAFSDDQGATWSSVTGVPVDGGEGLGGGGVSGSLDLVSQDGVTTVAYEIPGGEDPPPSCAAPKLAQTTDGATFDYCVLGGLEDGGGFGIGVALEPDGTRQAIFVARAPYGPFEPGIVWWREAP